MKKIVLIIVLISVYFLPAFSQSNGSLSIDTTFRKFSFKDDAKKFSLRNSDDFRGLLYGSLNDKSLLAFKFPDKVPDFIQNLTSRANESLPKDNMPNMKPRGYYPMRIFRPDSAIRYSILIKNIK